MGIYLSSRAWASPIHLLSLFGAFAGTPSPCPPMSPLAALKNSRGACPGKPSLTPLCLLWLLFLVPIDTGTKGSLLWFFHHGNAVLSCTKLTWQQLDLPGAQSISHPNPQAGSGAVKKALLSLDPPPPHLHPHFLILCEVSVFPIEPEHLLRNGSSLSWQEAVPSSLRLWV